MAKEDRSVRNLKLRWQNEPCYRYADQNTNASISYGASSLQALAQRIEHFLHYGIWSTVDAWLENKSENNYVLKALELSNVESKGSDQIERVTVPPLEAVIMENSQSQYDVYINSCGPIWGIAYAPEVKCHRVHATERLVFEKHIAVGVTRIGFKYDDKNDNCCGAGSDSLHYVGEEETYDNLLQVWVVKGTIHSTVDNKVKTEVTTTRKVRRCMIKKRDPNVIVKKGRPRKYPLVELESMDRLKVVRKRGRPRKHPIEKDAVVEELEGISAKVKSMGECVDERDGGDKRRIEVARGRKQVNSDDDDDNDDNESEGSSVYDSIGENMECDTNIIGEQFEATPEEDDDSPEPHQAFLTYCVELRSRGPVWGMSWAPTWSDSSPTQDIAAILDKSLGLLAVVCGDGCCLILLLPRDLDNSSSYSISPVIDESDVKVTELRILGAMVTCVAWSYHHPFKICCGMSDGSVTIWTIESSLYEGN